MKNIRQFIQESIIEESTFSTADWLKTNHDYGRDVVNKLISGEPVLLGKNGEDGAYYANTNEIARLREFQFDYTKDSLEEFNDILERTKWSNIFKGQFSGYMSKEPGQITESLVCYLFNGGKDILNWWKWCAKSDPIGSWNKSAEETVRFMNNQKYAGYKWDNKNYVACHVDGDDYEFPAGYDFALKITSLFKDKKMGKKILGVDCSDLYRGAKDTWNKADIVLVKKDATDVIDKLKETVVDGNSLNIELASLLLDGIVIPISLKKIVSADRAKIESFGLDDAEDNDIDIKGVDIKIQNKFPNGRYNGYIHLMMRTLDGDRYTQFTRHSSNDNALSVESSYKNAHAKAGRALSTIKQALGIPRGDGFFKVCKTADDAIKELESYGFEIDIPSGSNFEECEPKFQERACIAGLLGILDAYKRVKCNGRVDKNTFPIEFAKFCWLCSVQGTGAFFKIYD